MSNKLSLYETGNFTEPEMCNVWLKNNISNNSCQYSFVIATVGLILTVSPGAYAGFLRGVGATLKKIWLSDIHPAKRYVASSKAASRC